jgi:hypothetical protein
MQDVSLVKVTNTQLNHVEKSHTVVFIKFLVIPSEARDL